jgi:hypothetical protein
MSMSQPPEERMSEQVIPLPTPARVVPFERPQSELQKAVQQRAQEMIDRENERAVRARPAMLRRVLTVALATIPVILTFGAAIGFVGALRQFNTTVFESTPADVPANESATQASPPTSAEPGVVILQPYSIPVEPQIPPPAARDSR